MLDINSTIQALRRDSKRWRDLLRERPNFASALPLQENGRLAETRAFGTNPGNLRMFGYVPESVERNAALVVVLHGCTQTGVGYDHGAGWSTLADRYGFALLFPEQQRANNPNGCFNWFLPADSERGKGEALSIRQMVERMAIDQGIDRTRIFITGLSAGGAMTAAMMAAYPDVFEAGAIVAGVPYGAASNVQQAFEAMFQSPPRSPQAWGDLVRNASSHKGAWPRVSIWHGTADRTVVPANAAELVKQWTDVHHVSGDVFEGIQPGVTRHAWGNRAGRCVVERYEIDGMAHGTPISSAVCGVPGKFILDVGISSSQHIAEFFGLAEKSDRPIKRSFDAPQPPRQEGRTSQDAAASHASSAHGRVFGRATLAGAITHALKAAGLIKEP